MVNELYFFYKVGSINDNLAQLNTVVTDNISENLLEFNLNDTATPNIAYFRMKFIKLKNNQTLVFGSFRVVTAVTGNIWINSNDVPTRWDDIVKTNKYCYLNGYPSRVNIYPNGYGVLLEPNGLSVPVGIHSFSAII